MKKALFILLLLSNSLFGQDTSGDSLCPNVSSEALELSWCQALENPDETEYWHSFSDLTKKKHTFITYKNNSSHFHLFYHIFSTDGSPRQVVEIKSVEGEIFKKKAFGPHQHLYILTSQETSPPSTYDLSKYNKVGKKKWSKKLEDSVLQILPASNTVYLVLRRGSEIILQAHKRRSGEIRWTRTLEELTPYSSQVLKFAVGNETDDVYVAHETNNYDEIKYLHYSSNQGENISESRQEVWEVQLKGLKTTGLRPVAYLESGPGMVCRRYLHGLKPDLSQVKWKTQLSSCGGAGSSSYPKEFYVTPSGNLIFTHDKIFYEPVEGKEVDSHYVTMTLCEPSGACFSTKPNARNWDEVIGKKEKLVFTKPGLEEDYYVLVKEFGFYHLSQTKGLENYHSWQEKLWSTSEVTAKDLSIDGENLTFVLERNGKLILGNYQFKATPETTYHSSGMESFPTPF